MVVLAVRLICPAIKHSASVEHCETAHGFYRLSNGGGKHVIIFVVFENNVAVSRERLLTSSLDRQRRDIENAAQEI